MTLSSTPVCFDFKITDDNGVVGTTTYRAVSMLHTGMTKYLIIRNEPMLESGFNTATYEINEVRSFIESGRWIMTNIRRGRENSQEVPCNGS